MQFFSNYDWRKQASMTAPDDLEIEKAFSDQAIGFVENRVGDLMQDQYRIGFEIVKKNDDNTRMVGVYAFKVDKSLLFAPVFFINGSIKGPLLYSCEDKLFKPATKEWSAFFIDKLERNEGKGRAISRRSESNPLVQMQRINMHPSMNKAASCSFADAESPEYSEKTVGIQPDPDLPRFKVKCKNKDGEIGVFKIAAYEDGTIRYSVDQGELQYLTKEDAHALKSASGDITVGEYTIPGEAAQKLCVSYLEATLPDRSEQWLDVMTPALEKVSHVGLIKEAMNVPGFGKYVADAIVNHTTKGNEGYRFANLLAELYGDPDKLFPLQFVTGHKGAADLLQKKASSAGKLTIEYTVSGMEKSASSRFFADGFHIKDTRPVETMSVVVADMTSAFNAPDAAGMYDILKDGGEMETNVFVTPVATRGVSSIRRADEDILYVCSKNGRTSVLPKVLGIRAMCEDGTECEPQGDSLEVDGVYAVYTKSNTNSISPTFQVKKLHRVDGVTFFQACDWEPQADHVDDLKRGERDIWTYGDTVEYVYNPSLAKTRDNVFGGDVKFVRLSGPTRKLMAPLASAHTIKEWIYQNWSTQKVEIALGTKSASYHFFDEDKVSAPLSRLETLVKLARDMNIPAEKAYELVDTIDSEGSVSFFLEGHEKIASRLHLIDRPQFDDDFDSDFGVPLQQEKSYNLRVGAEQVFEAPSAIGDAMNPTTLTGLPNHTVVSSAPADLRGLADIYNLPNVFEHGVIGSLASTFNSMSLIDTYIPKLEQGVDVLGRIKFLLHWCPNDFEKAYGSDDMLNLESEIDSNFEAQGAMLLKLLKQSDKNKKNNNETTPFNN